jgi:hypothetical protein
MLIAGQGVHRRARRDGTQGQPVRAGGQRHRLVHRQDEHAAARHQHADLRNEDTLAEPQHTEGGELMRFDRVLTNPPFSLNWGTPTRTARPARLGSPSSPERFRYGQVPLGARRPT